MTPSQPLPLEGGGRGGGDNLCIFFSREGIYGYIGNTSRQMAIVFNRVNTKGASMLVILNLSSYL